VASDPRRWRVLDTRDDGEASLGDWVSPGLLIRPSFRRLFSILPSSSVFDTEAECSLCPFDICDLDFGDRGSCSSLLEDTWADAFLGSGVTTLMVESCSESEKTFPCLSAAEDLLLGRLFTFFEVVGGASIRL
jgi:hypothetical protein